MLSSVMFKGIFIFFLCSPLTVLWAETCESWFLKSGVTAGTKNCEMDCALIPSDMGSFDCSAQCDNLCKAYVNPDTAAGLAKYVERKALTQAEKTLISKHPADAINAFRLKNDALDSTQRIFGKNGWNDESDAFRHFVWSGLMANSMGVERAKQFLEAHEQAPDQPPEEFKMDTFNNEQGIKAGANLKIKDSGAGVLEKQAVQKLENGELQVLKPKGKVPKWK